MVFAKELINIGDSFRKLYLNSTDEKDKTEKSNLSSNTRSAVGGPYIGVHMRRLDFVTSRSKDVPSIKHAADQILQQMTKLNLQIVFVATDASKSGILCSLCFFVPHLTSPVCINLYFKQHP